MRGIEHHLDSQNITFEWPRPEGRIDYYTILWWNDLTPQKKVFYTTSTDVTYSLVEHFYFLNLKPPNNLLCSISFWRAPTKVLNIWYNLRN